MNQMILIDLLRETLLFAGMVAGPFLLTALLVGFVVSVIQAATQIQEATLSFFPKWLILLVLGLFLAPWILTKTRDYVTNLYLRVPKIIQSSS
jgi:flagellar biosynthetic protein FliQ